MLKKISLFFLVFIITSAFWGVTGYGAEDLGTAVPDEAYHNQKGLSHFKKGFYHFTPKHRKEEASQEYGLAIQEFKKALAINPANAETHRNLARVYYVQKKFLQAAEHYKKLTELDPYDIDAYLFTASAYEKARRYDEARAQLEIAKNMTTDLTYTLYEGYVGSDSFTFQANDGQADSNIATVSITVSDTSTDQVTIIVAQYKAKAKQLLVEATSSAQPDAVLTVVGYGEMTFSAAEGKYIYQSKVTQAPENMVTVESSLGGFATASVTVK